MKYNGNEIMVMGITVNQVIEAAKAEGFKRSNTADRLGISYWSLLKAMRTKNMIDVIFPPHTQKRVCGVPYVEFVEVLKEHGNAKAVAEALSGCARRLESQ